MDSQIRVNIFFEKVFAENPCMPTAHKPWLPTLDTT